LTKPLLPGVLLNRVLLPRVGLPVALLTGALLLGACAGPPADAPRTVAAVDTARYLGTWYEIARLPMWAQDSSRVVCEDVTATYTARADGRIGVLNRCVNALAEDAPRQASGSAYAVADSGNAKLRVSFFWPFHGDYWVLGLDPDYRWAVVGEPQRRWLWVLSRTPAMAPEALEQAKRVAREAGYDLAPLRLTRQRGA
jgi:apolipoprotein D and lipocalin family protein